MATGPMNSSQKFTDYRDILLEHLSRRQEEDPSFGIRAYSRELGISASQLSEVLRGIHGISPARAQDIASRLNLNERQQRLFCDLVVAETGRSKVTRQAAKKRLQGAAAEIKKHIFDEDSFRLIADWYHLAILALAETKSFSSNIEAIAKRLDISVHQAEMAVQRLLRVGMLKQNGKDLELHAAQSMTSDGVPSEAIRLFQSQILQKARTSITKQTLEERQISSMVFAVRKNDLPAARERLKEFRREFMREFERVDATADEVYCLNIALFGMSKTET